jgi:hypothetical protein
MLGQRSERQVQLPATRWRGRSNRVTQAKCRVRRRQDVLAERGTIERSLADRLREGVGLRNRSPTGTRYSTTTACIPRADEGSRPCDHFSARSRPKPGCDCCIRSAAGIVWRPRAGSCRTGAPRRSQDHTPLHAPRAGGDAHVGPPCEQQRRAARRPTRSSNVATSNLPDRESSGPRSWATSRSHSTCTSRSAVSVSKVERPRRIELS